MSVNILFIGDIIGKPGRKAVRELLPPVIDRFQVDLVVARGEGTFKRVIKEYKRIGLLILDEWLLVTLTSLEARDLSEIVEARHKRASTIFISQFAPQGWHHRIEETTLADAILDRIVHDSYTICIEGKDSMRKKKGIKV